MKVLKNVSFLSLEFDYGVKGNIDASIFVEIDNNGELQGVEHKIQLHQISFLDFLTQEQINAKTQVGNSFSSFLQALRSLITLKTASDLNLEIVDDEYAPVEPLRDTVKYLEQSQADQDELIMNILLGGA